ncbi:MAG: penicillin acylase family protein [Gemmatimonadaceae bacterium]
MTARIRLGKLTIGCVGVVAYAAIAITTFAQATLAPGKKAPTTSARSLQVRGLQAPVELIRDSAGIVHIRAQNEHDLFFAQGYSAARDRLFQLELWRRQATGTMAEALGSRWIERDRASRLLKFRGNMATELAHYHPRGASIIGAFVDGVNTFVAKAQQDTALMPPELKWLGITPGKWTPEVVISRHNALANNARDEFGTARAVRMLGEDAVKRRRRYEPDPVRLGLDSAVAKLLDNVTDARVVAAYDAFKNAPSFREGDVIASMRKSVGAAPADTAFNPLAYYLGSDADNLDTDVDGLPAFATVAEATALSPSRWESNNWVVSGARTLSGKPIVANDPHRTIATPSLRYLVHLQAPGWDVIGGGEPAIPGVAIGHNRVGAWGLTIFGIDAEDMYVYNTTATDARSYQYNGVATQMREVIDTIRVKDAAPSIVKLHFTRHGPVLYEDTVKHFAVALRAAWLEPGSAPYLASLRIDQSNSWTQFRNALTYARMPALNWVWGDTSGAIGWQAAGIAPIRKTWDGLVPVMGDGRNEWSGYLPIADLPHTDKPKGGVFGSANAFNVPADYTHFDAVAKSWAEPFRLDRLTEVLDTISHADVWTMARLQHDETPMAARPLLKLLRESVVIPTSVLEESRKALLSWNGVLSSNSEQGAIYAAFEKRLLAFVAEAVVPPKAQPLIRTVPLSRAIEWLMRTDTILALDPKFLREAIQQGRNIADWPTMSIEKPAHRLRELALALSLEQAINDVRMHFGADKSAWHYGDAKNHHVKIFHPLDGLISDALSSRLSPGPLPRGGYANTLNATGNSDNQTAGASLRVVIDVANWDAAIATNTPGQSGDPRSPHYADLFPLWAAGQYVPLPFSKAAVDKRAEDRLTIRP